MTAADLLDGFEDRALPPRVRGILRWAQEEFTIPDGPYRGLPFRGDRQPATRHYLEAIASGRWRRFVLVGCVQSGKTLAGWVIPAAWMLCERESNLVVAAPSASMAMEKWRLDLGPALLAGRYRERVPPTMQGGRGAEGLIPVGRAYLRLMHGKGGDKARAGFTAPMVAMTEVDGMDRRRASSREADPVTQLEQRAAAFADQALILMECTPSHDGGRVWREYQASTASRLAGPCPCCSELVTLERENLVGWHGAPTVMDARDAAAWECPLCAARFGDQERRELVRRSVVVHAGQETAGGTVTGAAKRTDTFGLRYNAASNLFWSTADVAEREWRAAQEEDRESAHRSVMQFTWALPVRREAGEASTSVLDRVAPELARGTVPPWAEFEAVGVDVQRHVLYWSAVAWGPGARCHIVAYGVIDTRAEELGDERGILLALRQLREASRTMGSRDGLAVPANLLVVDAGYRPDIVYQFIRETPGLAWPVKGYGSGQERRVYLAPRRTGSTVTRIGTGWHVVRLSGDGVELIESNADHWKTYLAARLATPPGQPGCLSLHAGTEREHFAFAKHLQSEKLESEWDAKGHWRQVWRGTRSANHWLDSTTLACLASGLVGFRPLATETPAGAQAPRRVDKRRALRITGPLTGPR